jgi:outer membrane protein
MRGLRIAVSALLTLHGAAAHGQFSQLGIEGLKPDFEEASYSAGIGAGFVPDYEGSDDYQPIPVINFRAKFERYKFQFNGQSALLDLAPFERIEFGPALGLSLGRDDVDDSVVELLRDIDPTLEAGAFVGWWTSPKLMDKDQLILRATFLHDVLSEHEGFTVDLGVSYAFNALQMLRISTGPAVTYASDDYMDTFFSIDANNAARSGLNTFTAGSGFKDVGWNGSATFFLSRQWNATAFLAYSRLLGDAADSPVVDVRGSENQFAGGVSVGYRW